MMSDGRRVMAAKIQEIQGQLAAMRAALEKIQDQWPMMQTYEMGDLAMAALAPDAGRGWCSPEKWAEVQGQLAAMRDLLLRLDPGMGHPEDYLYGRNAASVMHTEIQAALAVDAGRLAAEVLAAAEVLSDADLSFRSALDAGLREELPALGPRREQATRDVIAAVEALRKGGGS